MKTIHLNSWEHAHLDDVLKANRTDTRFVLSRGTFYVQSGWAYDSEFDHVILGPRCELIGEGMNATRIEIWVGLRVPEDAKQIECFTAGSRSGECSTVKIEGLTIVCPDQPPHVPKPVGMVGLHVWSHTCVIRNVRVENVTGAIDAPPISREGFGVLVNASGGTSLTRIGGAIIEDIEVVAVPNPERSLTFVVGFYCGYVNATEYSVCDNIRVFSLAKALPATAAFGVNDKVIGTRWQSYGSWLRGIYCDVKGGKDVLITNSMFEVLSTLVEFQTHGPERWENIIVSNSVADFTPQPMPGNYCAGLVLMDYSKAKTGSFANVQLQNCTLRAADVGKLRFQYYAAGLNTPAAVTCGLVNCVRLGARWVAANANTSPGSAKLMDS